MPEFMRTMAKDPVILGSGKRVQRPDVIIKGAEKLADLLFGDDQVDAGSHSTDGSRRKFPAVGNNSSSKSFHCFGVLQSHGSADPAARFQEKFGKSYGRFGGARAPLAQPESSRVTPPGSPSTYGPAEFGDCDLVPDEVDGVPSNLTFTDKPEEEKEEIFTEIAEKLKIIGDSYEQKGGACASASDLINVTLVTAAVDKLASNLTYENFKDAVSQAMQNEPDLKKFLFAYRLASAVAKKLGNSGSSSEAVRRFYLSYITTNLVGWVAENGGWGGVLRLLL